MFIREKEDSKINVYEVKINTELIKLFKQLIDGLFKEEVESLELYSSWGREKEFLEFLLMDKHRVIDFYYNDGYFNSSDSTYINIRGWGEKLSREDVQLPFAHTFMVSPEPLFEKGTTISRFTDYKPKLNGNDIKHKESLLQNEEAFYAVNSLKNLIDGGCHTSVGCRMPKIIQIPYTIFYADKILNGKFNIVDEAVKKEVDIEELLNFIIIKPDCISYSIYQLQDLLDQESFDKLMNQTNNTTNLVRALKK